MEEKGRGGPAGRVRAGGPAGKEWPWIVLPLDILPSPFPPRPLPVVFSGNAGASRCSHVHAIHAHSPLRHRRGARILERIGISRGARPFARFESPMFPTQSTQSPPCAFSMRGYRHDESDGADVG